LGKLAGVLGMCLARTNFIKSYQCSMFNVLTCLPRRLPWPLFPARFLCWPQRLWRLCQPAAAASCLRPSAPLPLCARLLVWGELPVPVPSPPLPLGHWDTPLCQPAPAAHFGGKEAGGKEGAGEEREGGRHAAGRENRFGEDHRRAAPFGTRSARSSPAAQGSDSPGAGGGRGMECVSVLLPTFED
jgi:hypothetical protein